MTSPSKSQSFEQKVAENLAGSKSKPKRQDGPGGRFYLVDDQAYPSVTHILKCISAPALIHWAANQERTLAIEAAADLYEDLAKITQQMPRTAYITTLQGRLGKTKAHQRELTKAGEIGTQTHALVEWHLRKELGQQVGTEPRVVDDAQWAFMSYQDWAKSVDLKPRFIEQMVFSRQHCYAGTMDLLAEVNGVLTLVDFKTGKGVYGEAHLQNVAYQMALREMGHSEPAGGLIVRLPKVQSDPAFETVVVAPCEDLFPVFLAVKELWVWWYAQDEAYRNKQKALKESA